MENKLTIKIGENTLVAEITTWADGMPEELVVYLRDKNNCIIQDICLVREHYHYNPKKEDFEIDSSLIDCKVWADSDSEDYTHEFTIGVYEEEE